MAYTHIAHDAFVGDHCVLANCASIAGHVTIEDWVIIEGVVAVQQFVRIGQHAFVAGGSPRSEKHSALRQGRPGTPSATSA